MRKTLLSVVLAGAVITTSPMASAATASFIFERCLAGCPTDGNVGIGSIASLVMSEVSGGVEFVLTSTSPLNTFISGLYFNGVSGAIDWRDAEQSYKSYNFSTISKATEIAANGYNWDFKFKTGKGAKSDLFNPGDVASWTISGDGVDLEDFSSRAKMMVRLEGWPKLDYSVMVAGVPLVATTALTPAVSSVPEPETYAIVLAGLALLSIFVRRRATTQIA